MQRKKERINKEKIMMGTKLTERKKLLLDKDQKILSSGNYKNKEDIYKKVFNDDELKALDILKLTLIIMKRKRQKIIIKLMMDSLSLKIMEISLKNKIIILM